jgi:hypothetical protein
MSGERGGAGAAVRRVAELLDAAASGAGAEAGLVVEDVHWADSATLDS